MPHGMSIDYWHAALLMPILWTLAGCIYAGMRLERELQHLRRRE
jgi:hypothetical protein